jgi:(S)-mandelate dehydrogenase
VTVTGAINIEDLRLCAKRHLPKIAFDFIEGGCDGETCLVRNETAFAAYRLLPRVLAGSVKPTQETRIFDCNFSSPFGVCPTGFADLWRPGADRMLAQAAETNGVPFLLSAATTTAIEEIVRIAPTNIWFQHYPTRDPAISDDLLARVRGSGIKTLVVTVDVPASSNRERNIRNGYKRGIRLSLRNILDGLRHPSWLFGFLKAGGMPRLENWAPYAKPDASPTEISDFFGTQIAAPHGWEELERLRRIWPGSFVVKGVLHPEDARQAAAIGADGVIVSNHGGRQLDYSPTPIDRLHSVVDAVGSTTTVMMDSGVRRGSDIAVALCLGAKFVFVGRATLYGVSAGGLKGADLAIRILRNELDMVIGQLGCRRTADLSSKFIVASSSSD